MQLCININVINNAKYKQNSMGTIYVENGIYYSIHSRDHNPPHLHIRYAEYDARIDIMSRKLIKGNLPKAQLKQVQEWLNDTEKQKRLVNMFYFMNPDLRNK